MGQNRISALAPWLRCVAAHLSTLWGCVAMQKALLWDALSEKRQMAVSFCKVERHGIFQNFLL